MIKRIIYNLVIFIISIFIISTITFFLFELVPGNIYDTDLIKSANIIANIKEKYGLDEHISTRYFLMLKSTFSFDFGNSFIYDGLSVNEIIAKYFPISAILGLTSLISSFIVGVFIGYISSNSKSIKNIFFIIIILLISLPTFIIAVFLQYYFCVKFNLFPILWSANWINFILPIIALSIYPTTFIARLLSESIAGIKSSDYVFAAKARGLNEIRIWFSYILKNAITPVISYMGPLTASLLTGSFIVETIFNIPGLGRYFIYSINNRDYPVVMGLTLFYAVILISTNFIANVFVSVNNYKGKRIENR
ncbi:MAG: ABC transporter permease [Candidatus Cloacimonetes bacterium]|nr:ABC transporter permease [Candidatus Cloacimonadota bacterium]